VGRTRDLEGPPASSWAQVCQWRPDLSTRAALQTDSWVWHSTGHASCPPLSPGSSHTPRFVEPQRDWSRLAFEWRGPEGTAASSPQRLAGDRRATPCAGSLDGPLRLPRGSATDTGVVGASRGEQRQHCPPPRGWLIAEHRRRATPPSCAALRAKGRTPQSPRRYCSRTAIMGGGVESWNHPEHRLSHRLIDYRGGGSAARSRVAVSVSGGRSRPAGARDGRIPWRRRRRRRR